MKLPDPVTLDEYKELAASLKRRRRAELLKPRSKRDRDLIDECEQTLLYCDQRILELGGEIRKSGASLGSVRLRWAAAIAVALALILATSVVAYAYGRKALSDQVQWNVRRILVENGDKLINRVETDISRNDFDEHSFDSEESLRAEYGDELLLPGSITGVYFVSATAYGEPGNALIRCEYRVNKKPLILEIDSFKDEDHYVHEENSYIYSEAWIHYPDDFDTVNRASLLIGEGPDCSFAYFSNGQNIYILTGGQGADIIVDIAKIMIEHGKEKLR